MANPHRGEVDLQVGKDTYTLSFSINAMCELEEAFDKPIAAIMEEMQVIDSDPSKVSMRTIRSLIWASLIDHHPGTSQADAGTIAAEAGLGPVMAKVMEAIGLATPEQEEATPKGGARPRKRNGSSR